MHGGEKITPTAEIVVLLSLLEVECQTCCLEQRSLAKRCRETSPLTAKPPLQDWLTLANRRANAAPLPATRLRVGAEGGEGGYTGSVPLSFAFATNGNDKARESSLRRSP